MLTLLGFVTIAVFLTAIITRRLAVIVALVLIPVIAALVGGFGPQLGDDVTQGIVDAAPVIGMLAFAIFYFCLQLEAGLFDPIIRLVIRLVKGDPLRLAVGTALLTLTVSLDGDGSSTFIIVCAALLPVYRRLGMRLVVLAGIVALAAGPMNILPWGGPTARAMAALGGDTSDIFVPLVPALIAGAAWAVVVAYILGRIERKRIGVLAAKDAEELDDIAPDSTFKSTKDTLRWLFNAMLTVALLVLLVLEVLPSLALFMIGLALAVLVNFPGFDGPKQVLDKHGSTIFGALALIFAASAFAGILTGTKMVDAMAAWLSGAVPEGAGGLIPVLVAITSMPLSLVLPPDAYYFGALPVFAETANLLGVDPMEVGRAALMGHTTTGFPISPLNAATFVLVSMAKVDLAKHQRFTFLWAFGGTVVMTLVALLTGAITL